MSSKRCYGCKCLEEESTTKFYARIKQDPKAKFFCKKCSKCSKVSEQALSPIRKRIRKIIKTKPTSFQVSDEEAQAMGRFYRKCPMGLTVGYIVPFSKGGRHEFSNLQYLSPNPEDAKKAKESTKIMKASLLKTHPFTPMPEGSEEHRVQVGKSPRVSKYKRVRSLSRKRELQKAT